ncbi:MAG TPA: tRNA (adenosine(37)-N6)-threonylcarbamoyltransferase complex dimerization subunit type 1 TsaB, partial [Stellaceae bacterium]|nr:tRNA (adenosine(37)-N6)-threonylcarbamoyltransferase complex dimerization subunit type 1 TsaB [Stellaceae bacterium]
LLAGEGAAALAPHLGMEAPIVLATPDPRHIAGLGVEEWRRGGGPAQPFYLRAPDTTHKVLEL